MSADFGTELKEILLQSAKARNESPRMKRIVAGEETEEAINVSVVQFYFHTIGFVRALRHLYARVPQAEFRAEIGEGLYEEETGRITETAPHLELFFTMAEAFGFPRKKLIDDAYCLPETAAVLNWYHYAATSLDVLEGVAVLNFAAEGQNAEIGGYPGISKVMYDAMTTHYGKSHEDIMFYYVHDYADQEHSEVGARNLAKYITTPEQKKRVRTAIQMTNDAWAGMSRFSERKLDECWKLPSGVFYQ